MSNLLKFAKDYDMLLHNKVLIFNILKLTSFLCRKSKPHLISSYDVKGSSPISLVSKAMHSTWIIVFIHDNITLLVELSLLDSNFTTDSIFTNPSFFHNLRIIFQDHYKAAYQQAVCIKALVLGKNCCLLDLYFHYCGILCELKFSLVIFLNWKIIIIFK